MPRKNYIANEDGTTSVARPIFPNEMRPVPPRRAQDWPVSERDPSTFSLSSKENLDAAWISIYGELPLQQHKKT